MNVGRLWVSDRWDRGFLELRLDDTVEVVEEDLSVDNIRQLRDHLSRMLEMVEEEML